jgi:hypothetical protein
MFHAHSSRIMALELTQPLTEMNKRNLPGARKAANFMAICEPTVQKMQDSRRLTLLFASMAHYRDSFTFHI